MIWNAGNGNTGLDGAERLAGAARATVTHAVAGPRGPRGPRGSLEQALPGEWAALLVTVAVIAMIGAAVLVATCLGHERVVAHRRARRAAPKPQSAPVRSARGAVRDVRRGARLEGPVHT